MNYPRELFEDHDRTKRIWEIVVRKFRERFGLMGPIDIQRAAACLHWASCIETGKAAYEDAEREDADDEFRRKQK